MRKKSLTVILSAAKDRNKRSIVIMHSRRGAGLRWRPLPKTEAPTEPTGETGYHPPAKRICGA
ncbi:MAG: hypothetical protein IKN56_04630 [Clostridia bacterium]|nr:hypothetical protein [Clostridia bacterium]